MSVVSVVESVKRLLYSVKKRDGRVVAFDQTKIQNAIYRAMFVTQEGNLDYDPQRLTELVVKGLIKKYYLNYTPTIEDIQDTVEETLIITDYPKTAKAYILYRNKRAEVREKRKPIPERVQTLVSESKKYFSNPLAEFVYYRTYSRWIEDEGRRETWTETVDRYMKFMHTNLADKLNECEYEEIHKAILKQEVMPSMRLIWSAGQAATEANVCAYNCSFIALSKIEDFAEIMYLLMCGTGVGFSVESQNAQQLPIVKLQTNKLPTYVIEDSKEGWGDALTNGLKAWFSGNDITFDFSRIRPIGSRLKTMGGRSSGPEPLKNLLEFSRSKILSRQGRRLSNIDVHDIICKLAEVVVMGGVRRAALISLSDLDDEEMRLAKRGQFFTSHPYRAMANNSAVYNEKPTAVQFLREWLALIKSGAGERGIFNRNGFKLQLPERRRELKILDAWATSGVNPCLSGDTLVYVADGRGHVSIKQLAEEGNDVPVFCTDDFGKVVVRFMRNPRLTGKNRPVYKITLDDGSFIVTTENHKFKLKSGEYRQVLDLKHGDSLSILTKFEASFKDIFKQPNSNSQDYWWINNGYKANTAEHRLIAEFHFNTKIPRNYVVHHKDRNAQNNTPKNLEILTDKEHNHLHDALMYGEHNPMKQEWSTTKWEKYKHKHSINNQGEKNKNFSGITNEQIREHILILTRSLGRRISNRDWANYAERNGLPQAFSKWRENHLGRLSGLFKWAAIKLGIEHVEDDPRVVKSYEKYTSLGYDCEIANGKLLIIKHCEVCSSKFKISISEREHSMCSISCGQRKRWQNRNRMMVSLRQGHDKKRFRLGRKQVGIYSSLKFILHRDPLKIEWVKVCKTNKVSSEIARASSPFRTFNDLKEAASGFNHKVVSVEPHSYEDVYNGTVDEFHNFFVGGFVSKTKTGKQKITYLNNLNCGEINLKNKQFCNLSEVIARPTDTRESLLEKIRIATIIGTYQSTFTNFKYISSEWKENCEKERLLGVSITGQWDCPTARNSNVLKELKEKSIEVNREYAKRFGINASTAITCVKPSGTVSQLVNASSGMHPRHSKYYIRRIRISTTDPLFHMLKDQKFPYRPETGQFEGSTATYVLEFPVKSPETTVFKNDLSALQQLEHWKMVKESYTEHNPSVTISVGPDEWIETANWLYNNWDMLGGLSFLPREEHVYPLAPYEEISKEKYDELVAKLPDIDFANIISYEVEDQTAGAYELACAGMACEIDFSKQNGDA